jgi:type I restriction enzyme R subunit
MILIKNIFMNNNKYNLVAENTQSTVVGEYVPDIKRVAHYQSEAELENAFIEQLKSQAYEYVSVTSEDGLILNLKQQLEKLNGITFTDTEWERFFVNELANPNQSIEEKTTTIQEDHQKIMYLDNGSFKTISLIDKQNIHNNSLQVINQYATEDGQRSNRYDVTVLVNGLPLVHIELKRRGVPIREAFNQINRYQRESFWASSGLFEYVQLFVVSNGTHTKYYSNTTRSQHIKEANEGGAKKGKRTSNSFEFTSWWADATNHPITELMDFAKTFFAKHTLLNILTRYCVFTTEKLLLVMRP